MSMDALKAIKLAEDEADDIKRQAAQKARDIISAIEREGDELLRKVTKEAQNNSQALLAEATRDAEMEIDLLHKAHEKQKMELITNAAVKMNAAVSLIVGKVVGLNGNR